MIVFLALVTIGSLIVGTFYFVLWMEEWDEKRKQKRLEDIYNDEDDWDDDDWWHEQGV